MSLTGAPLAYTAVTVAVVALGAVILAWPVLGRRGALPVLGRIGALVSVQALIAIAALVIANDHFDFYSSFADLTGQQAAVTTQTSGGTSAADRASTAGSRTAAALHAVHDPGVAVPGSDGRVEQLTLPGPASGMQARALVLLPVGYHDSSQARRSYPVIEAFHGYPGTPEQWLDAMHLQTHLDAAVAAHDVAASIVVIPDLAVPPGRDSECLNGPAGQPQLETWLTQDVPADIAADYRVDPAPRAWAATGFSMGGWCAAMATMLHPAQYCAAMVFGGYFDYEPGTWKPYPLDSPKARRDDLVSLARAEPPAVAVWAQTARTDPSSYPSTQALAAAARAPLSVTLAVQASGGHRTSLWADELPAALAWLGQTVAAFRWHG